MTHTTILVVALKSLTLVLGGLITYYSYRAYRRTGSRPLRALAIGFGIVTLGALLAGVADLLPGIEQNVALAVESGFTVLGFAVIVYSLFVD